MKNKTLIICGFLLFTMSCHDNSNTANVESINVEITSNAELVLSEHFTDFRVVKLETPDDYLIGEIQKIRIYGQKIYISDGTSIFVFSENGKLISSFSHIGNGPHEYTGIKDFTIIGEDIIVFNRSQHKLLKYDLFGNNLSEVKLDYWGMSLSPAIDDSYLMFCGYEPGEYPFKVRLLKDEKATDKFLPIKETQTKYLHVSTSTNFATYNNLIYFFEIFNDTVYSFRDQKLEPEYFINFQGKNIPQSFLDKDYENVYSFSQAITSYAYGIDKFCINNGTAIFCSYYEQTRKITLANLQNKTSRTFASIKDDVFFKSLNIPVGEFEYFADENIVFLINAHKLNEWNEKYTLDNQYKEIVDTTSDDDNPILFIFNAK